MKKLSLLAVLFIFMYSCGTGSYSKKEFKKKMTTMCKKKQTIKKKQCENHPLGKEECEKMRDNNIKACETAMSEQIDKCEDYDDEAAYDLIDNLEKVVDCMEDLNISSSTTIEAKDINIDLSCFKAMENSYKAAKKMCSNHEDVDLSLGM